MGPILEEYREALLTLRILRRRLLFNRLALLTAIPHYWVVTLWIYYRRIATGAIKQFVFSVVFAVFGFAAVLLTPWLHDLIAFPVLMICFDVADTSQGIRMSAPLNEFLQLRPGTIHH